MNPKRKFKTAGMDSGVVRQESNQGTVSRQLPKYSRSHRIDQFELTLFEVEDDNR